MQHMPSLRSPFIYFHQAQDRRGWGPWPLSLDLTLQLERRKLRRQVDPWHGFLFQLKIREEWILAPVAP